MATARRTALLLRVSQSCAAAFVERGDTSTTIAELAERAEISERTFYRCFATKEESIWPMLDDGNRASPPHSVSSHAIRDLRRCPERLRRLGRRVFRGHDTVTDADHLQ
ncbi:hypothetical protein GCM10020255_055570 [Rhodococcus baikonurensis]